MAVPIPPPLPATGPEPGYSTTEFWATQVTSAFLATVAVLDATGTLHVSDAVRTAVVAAVVPVIGLLQSVYALGRSIRKKGT